MTATTITTTRLPTPDHVRETRFPSNTLSSGLRSGNVAVAVVASVVILGLLVFVLVSFTSGRDMLDDDRMTSGEEPLVIQCAAGIAAPMEEIEWMYERKFGIPVDLSFGGSKALVGTLAAGSPGDLAVIADDQTARMARDKGLLVEGLALAQQQAVVVVQAGNPKGISGINDLLREDVRFGLVDPTTASVGAVAKASLSNSGHYEKLSQKSVVTKTTVSEIAGDVALGSIDAAIIWDAMATVINSHEDQPKVETIAIPQLAEARGDISINVTSQTKRSVRALHFARFATAPGIGAEVFRRHGFVSEGLDQWTDKPEITLYSGTVNRPAIQTAIDEFEEREGVSVTTKWNGCGVLTADMRDIAERIADGQDIRIPDMYYTCDGAYIGPVTDLFPQAQVMSETDVVIAVQEGNPKNITGLQDLTREGLRIGVSHEEQSTLGWLTLHMLQTENLYDQVHKNVQVVNPQADFLMAHLRTGALDAVIVYLVSAEANPDGVDVVMIDANTARAVQTFSVGKSSPYPALVQRFQAYIHRDREAFESVGLRWRQENSRASDFFVVVGGPGSD